MSGLFVAVLGAVWRDVRLSDRIAGALFWVVLYAMYVSSAGLVLAAVFGTSDSTPLMGGSWHGSAWQEGLVSFALISGGAAGLLAGFGVVWGLRRRVS